MTKIYKVRYKCPVCKSNFDTYAHASINFLHSLSPLLMDGISDTNVSPHMCTHCGYVSYDFEANTNITIDDVRTKAYMDCDGFIKKYKFKEKNTAFYRHYLLAKKVAT